MSETAACLLSLFVVAGVFSPGGSTAANRSIVAPDPGRKFDLISVTPELPVVKPESAGFSSKRLQRIHATIQRAIDAGQFTGAVTLVARGGRIVHLEAHGQMDLESRRPMSKDAIFHIASMSKPVTSVAVLMLVEEGKIRLTDPVSRFIPEFKEMKVAAQNEGGQEAKLVPANREITIRDLLTHTSGLASMGTGASEATKLVQSLKPGFTLADVAPRLASLPLDFQPGSLWRYSPNVAFDLLGRIIEIASGQTFDRFLRERLFEPLGMKDTYFVMPDDRRPRVLTKYRKTANGLERAEIPPELFGRPYFSGAAGLLSTAEDYFRFAQMLLDRGGWNGQEIIGPRSVELMSSNFVGDMFAGQLGRPKGMGYGLGVEIVQDSAQATVYRPQGSFGWDGAFGTYFWVDPGRQMVAILMVQAIPHPGRTTHNDFDTAVMQAMIKSPSDRVQIRN